VVTFPRHPDAHALADAASALAKTAIALRGTYVPGRKWGPCGRLDAVLEGVEVVARTLDPPYGACHRTFVRGYAPHPVLERVALRRRTLRTTLVARLAGAPGTGEALLDRVLVASEQRKGLVDAFLDERLRVALRRLVEIAAIEEHCAVVRGGDLSILKAS
jgi:hypothetical protein